MDLFRNRNFVALYLSRNSSRFGDQFTLSALLVLVALTSHDAPWSVAWVVAAGLLPGVFLGWASGALADRWEKRRAMIGSDLFRFLAVLSLIFVHGLWLMVVMAFMVGVGGTFYRPSFQAIMPEAVGDDQIFRANAVNQATANVVDFAGMALAGLVILFLGIRVAFGVDAGTYLVSATSLLFLRSRLSRPDKPRTFAAWWSDVAEGVSEVTRHETTRALMLYMGLVGIPMGVFNAMEVLLPPEVAHVSVKLYPYLPAVQGAAMTLAGLLLARLSGRVRRRQLIIGGFLTSALILGLMGFAWTYTQLLVLAFSFGFANLAFLVPVLTSFQMALPAGLRARAMAFYTVAVNSALLIGTFAGGYLAAGVGVATTLVCVGLGIGAVGVLALFGRARLEPVAQADVAAGR